MPEKVPLGSARAAMPFDSYALSDQDLIRMQTEHAALLQKCARSQGADVQIGGDYIRPGADVPLAWGGRFGTMGLEHAARYGYHADSAGSWNPVGGFYLGSPDNVQAGNFDDARAAEVMYGSAEPGDTEAGGSRGCVADVEKTIGGPLVTTVFVLSDLVNLSLTHPDVRMAVERWRTCMRTEGFTFRDVFEPSEQYAMSQLGEEEIRTAVADVNCTTTSGWADVFYFVLADYERQAIAQQPALFENALASATKRLRLLDAQAGGS